MARLGNLLALLSTALLATESQAAKRTFAKKKGKTAEEVLRIEVPTSKARDLIVDKLGILIRHEKEVKKQG